MALWFYASEDLLRRSVALWGRGFMARRFFNSKAMREWLCHPVALLLLWLHGRGSANVALWLCGSNSAVLWFCDSMVPWLYSEKGCVT